MLTTHMQQLKGVVRKERSNLLDRAARQVVATESTPMEVRQAAAVNFKNHVKRYWEPGRDVRGLGDDTSVPTAMPDAEKVGKRPVLCQMASRNYCISNCLLAPLS